PPRPASVRCRQHVQRRPRADMTANGTQRNGAETLQPLPSRRTALNGIPPTSLSCAHRKVTLRVEDAHAWWACEECVTPFAPAGLPAASPATVDVTDEPEYLS